MKLYDVIRKEQAPQNEEAVLAPREPSVSDIHPKHKKKKRIFFLAITLSCMTLFYVIGLSINRATITIVERTIPFTLDQAVLDLPHQTESDSERLSFQTMRVSAEIKREIFGSELTQVTGKAKGSVIFFNEYSTSTQTIKSGTRLLGTNKKTYQTQQTVTIPGYTLDAKKKKTAGTSTPVSVIAIDTGSASNSPGLSFSITGYSGTKKTQLYARSVGALAGGEAGMFHTVSDAERPALLESLKTQLSEKLRRETRAEIPENLVTYPDLQFISIDTDSLALEGEGIKFTAQIKGTMVSYLISRDLLESAIAKEVLSDHSYPEVSIPGLESLDISPESPIPANTQTLPESISLLIKGQGTLITKAPLDRLRDSFVGQKRGSFNNIIGQFPEIQSASFSLFPFWSPFFPKQLEHIHIKVQ